jgi:hypothetical protein
MRHALPQASQRLDAAGLLVGRAQLLERERLLAGIDVVAAEDDEVGRVGEQRVP